MGESSNIYQSVLAEPDAKTGQVSTEQLQNILVNKSAVVVDTRSRAEFVAGHIPGASGLNGDPSGYTSLIEHLVSGDKRKALVLYCNGPFCQASKRLADQLIGAGYSNVRRYQLGMPIWRALGGLTEIELEGVTRIFKADRTAVYFDARSASDFAKGSLPGAHNISADNLQSPGLPFDDFNRRLVLFGRDAEQAQTLARAFSKRAWHNVSYFPGRFEALLSAVGAD
jgi:rhodanese-related sulfurtransferase